MALVDAATFDGREVTLVYIAGRVNEGRQVEQVLSQHGVDYAVDIEPFQTTLLGILPVEYEGVGFYVASDQADRCCAALRAAGLVQGLVENDD